MTTEQQSLVGGSEIEKLRKEGITDKGIMGKLSTGRLELQKIKEEQKSMALGGYISLKDDKEEKTLLFTGEYQVKDVPKRDFKTGRVIPGKTVKKWAFSCYDLTFYDPNNHNNPPRLAIFERGQTEAEEILDWL